MLDDGVERKTRASECHAQLPPCRSITPFLLRMQHYNIHHILSALELEQHSILHTYITLPTAASTTPARIHPQQRLASHPMRSDSPLQRSRRAYMLLRPAEVYC